MEKNKSTIFMVVSIILLTPALVLTPQSKLIQGILFVMAIMSLVTGIMAVKLNREYMRAKDEETMSLNPKSKDLGDH